jgi:hypothetical protein
VEPGVLRRLQLLQYLDELNLSPEETLALMRRLATATCRPEACERLSGNRAWKNISFIR